MHGSRQIFGYRVGSFAYLTDCSAIPDAVVAAAGRGADADSRRAARAAAPDASVGRAGARGRAAARARSAPTSRTCATICRTRRPARGCRPAWSWHMMASRSRSPRRCRLFTIRTIRSPPRWHQPVLALGNFDGMHRGHLKIVERVRRAAEERGTTALAMTFDPHPSKIVRPDKAPPLLMTEPAEARRLARAGMHGVAIVRFTPELARGIRKRSSAPCSWNGCTSPRSGWARTSCSATTARARFRCCAPWARATAFAPRRSIPCATRSSSSAARAFAGWSPKGGVDEAGALLGHYYEIDGTVVKGQQRGRGLGFPTANLCTENELVPPRGVYATTTRRGRRGLSVDHEHRRCGRRSRTRRVSSSRRT